MKESFCKPTPLYSSVIYKILATQQEFEFKRDGGSKQSLQKGDLEILKVTKKRFWLNNPFKTIMCCTVGKAI